MYEAISQIEAVDQFFLVLMKLRGYITNFKLSRLFNISESDVYNCFCTWTCFMSLQWRKVSLDVVRFFAPDGFKAKFPTRVIVDGTECLIKKPTLPKAQQSTGTYSTYKNRNTMKVLVGITSFFRRTVCQQNQFSRTRKLHPRVHVEHFIGLAKTYKILLNPMNMSETQLSSDIIFVFYIVQFPFMYHPLPCIKHMQVFK